MSNIRIYLLTGLKIPKLQVGPTLESPGPMLFKVAAIAVKFVESYRHLYQHFDSGNECLSCFAFEISSEPCECACPYNASCLGDERVSGRIFLYEFQIAVSAAVGTHVARFGLYPICIGQAGFDAPPDQRVELDQ